MDEDTAERAPAATVERGGCFYLPPAWIGRDHGDALELLEWIAGDRVELSGSLRGELLAGERPPALATMARCDPSMARLHEALQGARLQPLDRAVLLRGPGYGQLFVELTARCNERCVHCYAESSPERDEALDEPTLCAALDDARALGFRRIQLTGGDPLVSPLCVRAAEYAAALGFEIEIYTNGLGLSDRLYAQLAAHGVTFAFSFYSADPDIHDAITRTRGSQRRTLAAIERVLAGGLRTRVSIVVMEQNLEQLEATRALLLERGVEEAAIGMDVQRSVGRGLMTLRPKQAGIGGATAGHKAEPGQLFDGRAALSYDGTVYPCIFSRAFALGSVHERRLRDILSEPVPIAFDDVALRAEFERREAQLACWDCRLRASLLALQPSRGASA